jgi:hypothetical protein
VQAQRAMENFSMQMKTRQLEKAFNHFLHILEHATTHSEKFFQKNCKMARRASCSANPIREDAR